MVKILMMSAKMATAGLLKGYYVIYSVYVVINKIFVKYYGFGHVTKVW